MTARGSRRILLPAIVSVMVSLDSTGTGPAEELTKVTKVEREEIRLILIDAVVTGEGGRPVPGLSRADFRLRVDGREAAIAAFDDRCTTSEAILAAPGSVKPEPYGGSGSTPSGESSVPGLPASGTTGVVPPAAGDPIRLVLYFDLPHLSGPGAARSVRAARAVIEKKPADGARMMVVSYGPEVRILAPFTTDRGVLAAALDQVTASGATYDEGPVARERKIEAVSMETCLEALSFPQCANQLALAREYAREEEALARRSLDALRATLSALAGVRGRKGIVLFTETLRDEPGVQYLEMAKTSPRAQQISLEPGFKELMEEASASQVAFYTLHAAGLEDPSDVELGRSATNLGTTGGKILPKLGAPRPPPRGGKGQMESQAGPLAQANRTADAAALGFSASAAAETGGIHLGRTNDLGRIFDLARDALSCYYVLSYRPPASGDGKRHSLIVDVARKGVRVRARPFYIDWTVEESRSRRLETALAAPGAFRGFEIHADAFVLGGATSGRQVLVKTSIPVEALARSIDGSPAGAEIELRGRISSGSTESCFFETRFAVPETILSTGARGTIHSEAACVLPPGRYELVTAVMETRGETIAASRRQMAVPAISGFLVGDVTLWAASEDDFVQKEKAEAILGPSRGLERGAATPRVERKLIRGEKGSLYFLVCPSGTSLTRGVPPVTVLRSILAGEDPVATFPPLKLTDPPDARSGCWGVLSSLPEKVLGEGVYTFDYEVHAGELAEPVHRRADFEVEEKGPASLRAP